MVENLEIKDTRIAEAIDENGFVVVPGLDAPTVSNLLALQGGLPAVTRTRLNFNTGADLPAAIRRSTFRHVTRACTPLLDRLFAHYDIVAAMMFVKRPSSDPGGRIRPHCDPTLLPDETRHRHLNLWLPLVDVDETNGALHVVPRSHRILAPVHAPTMRAPFADIVPTVCRHGTCMRMRAGELLVFDNRMIHYSQQNQSPAARPAIVLSIAPAGVPFIALFNSGDPESPIEVYRQTRSWYLDGEWINDTRPPADRFIGTLAHCQRALGADEFARLIESPPPHTGFAFRTTPPGMARGARRPDGVRRW